MYLKIIIISQLKKIVPKKMNFGSPNLTKQKKKPRNTTKCHTKKNPKNTTKCHNIFIIYFLFPTVVGLSLILLFYFFMSIVFSQQIFGEKLLMVLK